jgi:hypothetical protein
LCACSTCADAEKPEHGGVVVGDEHAMTREQLRWVNARAAARFGRFGRREQGCRGRRFAFRAGLTAALIGEV